MSTNNQKFHMKSASLFARLLARPPHLLCIFVISMCTCVCIDFTLSQVYYVQIQLTSMNFDVFFVMDFRIPPYAFGYMDWPCKSIWKFSAALMEYARRTIAKVHFDGMQSGCCNGDYNDDCYEF